MDLYFRQSTYTEDLTAAHVLQKVAHHQVRCSLYIRRRNPNDFSAVIDEGSRIGLNRKTNHVEVRIALRISLACRFKDQLLTYGTVFWSEDKGHRFLVAILNQSFRRK